MSDIVIGLVGADFVMLLADRAVSRSIVVYNETEDKIVEMDNNKLFAVSGPAADRVHFTEFIDKNVALYAFRNAVKLSTTAAANFTRNELAEALRSKPFQTNLLIAGYDSEGADVGPHLYIMDYLASMHKVSVGAHGYASYFAYSIFDRYYQPNCDEEQAKSIMSKIVGELRTRFLLGVGAVIVKVVDKNGIRIVDIPQ